MTSRTPARREGLSKGTHAVGPFQRVAVHGVHIMMAHGSHDEECTATLSFEKMAKNQNEFIPPTYNVQDFCTSHLIIKGSGK